MSSSYTILCYSLDTFDASSSIHLLESYGYRILQALDTAEFFILLEHFSPSLVIIFELNSETAHISLLQEWQQRTPLIACPVLVVATNKPDLQALETIVKPHFEFLWEPFTASMLMIRVELLLQMEKLKQGFMGLAEKWNDTTDIRQKMLASRHIDEEAMDMLIKVSIEQSKSQSEINHLLLDSCVRLTSSKLGFLYFVNSEENGFNLYIWSKGAAEACKVAEPMDFSLAHAGMWAESLRTRSSFCCNSVDVASRTSKLPKGHIPISRILTIPIMSGSKILAILGVANKLEAYTDDDKTLLVQFGNHLVEIISNQSTILASKLDDYGESRNDPLIEYMNSLNGRQAFFSNFDTAWNESRKAGSYISCIMVDIDYFTVFNHRYGHPAGDLALKKIESAIKSVLHQLSYGIFKNNGMNFLILLTNQDEEATKNLSIDIIQAIRNLQIPHAESAIDFVMTASAGFKCMIPTEQSTPMLMYKQAINALYRAKQNGRNRAEKA